MVYRGRSESRYGRFLTHYEQQGGSLACIGRSKRRTPRKVRLITVVFPIVRRAGPATYCAAITIQLFSSGATQHHTTCLETEYTRAATAEIARGKPGEGWTARGVPLGYDGFCERLLRSTHSEAIACSPWPAWATASPPHPGSLAGVGPGRRTQDDSRPRDLPAVYDQLLERRHRNVGVASAFVS